MGRGSVTKNLPAIQEMQETQVRSLSWEDGLEEKTGTHSSILAWKPHGQRSLAGYIQCMGSQTVRHNLATKQQQHADSTLCLQNDKRFQFYLICSNTL